MLVQALLSRTLELARSTPLLQHIAEPESCRVSGRRSAVPGLITAAWNAAGVATALPLCGERAPAMSAAVRTSTQLVVTNLCSACTGNQ